MAPCKLEEAWSEAKYGAFDVSAARFKQQYNTVLKEGLHRKNTHIFIAWKFSFCG